MNPATLWTDHTALALLGTARSPVLAPLPAPWSALEDPTATAPRRLASRLAGLAAGLRAGRDETPGTPPWTELPEETRPVVGLPAQRLLGRLLQDSDSRDLLQEWLELALDHGKRPPSGRIPDLVLEARTRPGLAKLLPLACGPLLSWYAALDPRAASLVAPPVNALEAWESTETPHRLAALHRLRAQTPTHARTLLQGVWKGENAEARATLLEALATGLGPDDEPFLESCLNDRSSAVRSTAARILADLATSACLARLRARLATAVRLDVRPGLLGLGRNVKVKVELPPSQDAALERDLGIGSNPGQKTSPSPPGERARLLELLVSRSGLAPWRESSAQAGEILEAFARKDFAPALSYGLKEAAVREKDREWSLALLQTTRHGTDPGLLQCLSVAERRAHLLGLADKSDESALAQLLEDVAPWEPDHTREVSRQLWARRAAYRDQWMWRTFLPLANRGHLDALRGELSRWQAPDPQLEPGLSRLLVARIELRTELHQAFAKDATP